MSYLGGTADVCAADGFYEIAGLDACFFGRGAWGYVPGLDAGWGVQPGDAIIRNWESAALIEIFGGENDRGNRKNHENYCAYSHS